MRVQKDFFVISFASTEHAMQMETFCKEQGLRGRLIPTPRAITASCGLAWKAEAEDEGLMRDKIKENHLSYDDMQVLKLWEFVE